MKTPQQIEDEIDILKEERKAAKLSYSKMGQIDMMSGEGNQAQENINKTEGKITALKWALK